MIGRNKRRARDSNPQPLAGHLISSQVPHLSNDVTHQELRDDSNGEVPTVVPCPREAASGPACPPDLANVVVAWGALPNATNSAVKMLILTAKGSGYG